MIEYEDILRADARIAPYIDRTPLLRAVEFSRGDTEVFLKLECVQQSRSFKLRGALNRLLTLTPAEKSKGVITVSSGNHGAAVSYACHLLGVKSAVVYVPETCPDTKVEKIAYYGAQVRRAGQNYDQAHRAAMRAVREQDLVFIDSSSDQEVIAGQGTIALELLRQNPELDTILVPIGGGGIITGIAVAAKHIRPGIRICGVQPAACPAMLRAMEDNRFYAEYPSEESLCDALVGGVAEIPFRMARQCIDRVLLVSEAAIRRATVELVLAEKIVAEPSSATCMAAIREHPAYFAGHRTAAVLTGGNLDGGLLKKLLLESGTDPKMP